MILVFNTEAEANTAIDLINTNYGCYYEAPNGYIMENWDNVKKAANEDKWYFTKPLNTIKTAAEAMVGVAGYTEQAAVSERWVATSESQ